jgi:hypothetical protein
MDKSKNVMAKWLIKTTTWRSSPNSKKSVEEIIGSTSRQCTSSRYPPPPIHLTAPLMTLPVLQSENVLKGTYVYFQSVQVKLKTVELLNRVSTDDLQKCSINETFVCSSVEMMVVGGYGEGDRNQLVRF